MEFENPALYEKFNEAAMLNKMHDPWLKKRIVGEYAECEITSCEQSNWWYNDFIGIKFFGELRFNYDYGQKELVSVVVVKLVGSKIHHGRDVSAKDVSLV